MKKGLIVRLFIIQRDLKQLTSYSPGNCLVLFRCSIAFESVLDSLLKENYPKFDLLSKNHYFETQPNCRLCCEFTDTTNRNLAYKTGIAGMNANLKDCLSMLVTEHDIPIETYNR